MNLITSQTHSPTRHGTARAKAQLRDAGYLLWQPFARFTAIKTTVLLLVIGVIATLLRVYMLAGQSLWLDEGSSLAMTSGGTISTTMESLWAITGGDKYQPVYFAILTFWRSTVGNSQFMLQMLSVVPGVLTPFIIYLGVKRTFGESHAMLSALFIACSSFCIAYSQEVRPYAFLLCLASLQFLLFSPALKQYATADRRQIALFSVITLVCCISSIFLVLFSIGLAVAHALVYRNIRSWVRWWVPAMLASLPAFMYYLSTPARSSLSTDAINATGTPLWENLVFGLYGHIAGQTFGPSLNELRHADQISHALTDHLTGLLVLCALCIVLALYTISSMRQLYKEQSDRALPYMFVLMLFIASLTGMAILAKLTTLNWMPRHSFFLMVPLSVLLSIAVVEKGRHARGMRLRTWVNIPMLAFTGIIMANQVANYNYFFKADYSRDDYRSAARFLNDHVGAADSSIMLWGEPYLLSYYGHSSVESLWRLEEPALIMSRIDEVAADSSMVYVSINRLSTWEKFSEALQAQLHQKYILIPAAEFNNFSIFKLEQLDPALAMNPSTAMDDANLTQDTL